MSHRLIYAHDPMCSWCWGFEPVRKQLFQIISERMRIDTLLGGLAPDSDQPMPESMQLMLKGTWKKIQSVIPGTEFNFAFWDVCKPLRSTYPANRAVIAARMQGKDFEHKMILRIQQAYYLEASNPSDSEELSRLAAEIGLGLVRFDVDICSAEVEDQLSEEINSARLLGLNSFPSIALETGNRIQMINIDYLNVENILEQIDRRLKLDS